MALYSRVAIVIGSSIIIMLCIGLTKMFASTVDSEAEGRVLSDNLVV